MSHPVSSDLRQEYQSRGFGRADARPDPIDQFKAWFDAAVAAGLPEPNAMTLATAAAGGPPSARMVLMKEYDARGLVFYTNTGSQKGRELAGNPRAALLFFWQPLSRQVRFTGPVAPVSEAEADAYFASRPLEAQLAAWASRQSEIVASRAVLEARMAELRARHGQAAPARPPDWGGYRLRPDAVEFWQGRAGRLHDRLLYRRAGLAWEIVRLSP